MPTLTPANAAIASMRIAAASLNGFINGPLERLDSVPMRLRFGATPASTIALQKAPKATIRRTVLNPDNHVMAKE
jgi:hypothetical protein